MSVPIAAYLPVVVSAVPITISAPLSPVTELFIKKRTFCYKNGII